MNKRLIKFLTFAIFLIASNPVFSQTETPKDSLLNKNSVLTKKEIQASAKTGLYSLLLTQPGFIQNKKSMTFRGLSWNYTKIELDGLDIKDPFSGELAFDPVLQTLDNITINDAFASGKVSLNSNQDYSVLRSSAGYLFDGFDPGKNTRGMQSVYATVSGPVLNWQSLSFAATAKRTLSKSLWLNGEPVAEFWDGVNVRNIPFTYSEFNAQNNSYSTIKYDTSDVSYPVYRNGAEKAQYDLSGQLKYENEFFTLKYQVLGQTSSGREGITPSNIFAFENRPEFKQNSQLHQLSFTQKITDQLKYSVSGSYYSKYFTSYDPAFKDNVMAYGDPDQNSNYVYGNIGNIYRKKTNKYFADFYLPGSWELISGYAKNKQNYFELTGNIQFQLNSELNFSAGFKNRNYELRNLKFNPIRLKQIQNNFQKSIVDNPDYYKSDDFPKYAAIIIGADNYGYDVLGNETDDDYAKSRKPTDLTIWGKTEINFDAVKLEGLIGLQKLNVGGIKLKPQITLGKYDYLNRDIFSNSEDENNILFDFGLKAPISEELFLFGNISKENILPPLAENNTGIALMSKLLGFGNAFNSPILIDPKSIEARTINIGMSFTFEELVFASGKFFVNDFKNLPKIRIVSANSNGQNTSFYGIMQEGDQAYKGLEGQVKTARWNYLMASGKLNYSFESDGGSASSSQFRTVWSNSSDSYNPSSQFITSGGDEYQYNLELDFHANQEHEFVEAINEFGFNFSVQGNSGYSYTSISSFGNSQVPTEKIGSSKTPNFMTFDLSCDLGFSFYNLNGMIFLKVENLANKKVELEQNGYQSNNGYVFEDDPAYKHLNYEDGQKFKSLYNALVNQNHPEFFGSPRTVTFGVKLDF